MIFYDICVILFILCFINCNSLQLMKQCVGMQVGVLPDLLVCISAGFFGFQLWTLVRNRCASSAFPLQAPTVRMIHYTRQGRSLSRGLPRNVADMRAR